MTQDQFEKAVEVNETLRCLEELNDEISAFGVKLTYVRDVGREGCKECDALHGWAIEESMKKILKKHDRQIKDEIERMRLDVLKCIEEI